MATIVPAILSRSYDDVLEKLNALQGVSTSVQIDVVDGVYASPATWPYVRVTNAEEISSVCNAAGALQTEIDLMVEHPEREIGVWIHAGVPRITLHAESLARNPHSFSDIRNRYGISKRTIPELLSLGIAIRPSTNISLLEPYMEYCQYIQCMGIAQVGKQGQPFEQSVLLKIRTLRKKYPTTPIQVDGGVSLETAPHLIAAGASRLIVGSAMWNAGNVRESYAAFEKLA